MLRVTIIGISSVSGGGKTAVAKELAELLRDAVAIHFDDYDDAIVHPADLRGWLAAGADYNAWKTPTLTRDMEMLKIGRPIRSPIDNSEIAPAKYVVFDAPFGRAHIETGRLIDFMVFIDTPLDVAMARRILRDFGSGAIEDAAHCIERIRTGLSSYLDGRRRLYLEMQRQVKPTCDLVLDGNLPVDDLAHVIVSRLEQLRL